MKKIPSLVVLAVMTSLLAAGVIYYSDRSKDPASPNSQLLNNPGMAIAIEKGCIACHTVDGTAGIGPTWKGTYGTLRTLSDGSQILADDAYLDRSIREPAAEVVKGFENIMIAPELSQAELGQLLQVIRDLGTTGTE
jgi:cytochrome c oxidase subunit II